MSAISYAYSVLMDREIKWAGEESNPVGTHDQRRRFTSLCNKAARRWRKEHRGYQTYAAVYNAQPIADTVTNGWHASQDEAILVRCLSNGSLNVRDVMQLHSSSERLGWEQRTHEEYEVRARELLAEHEGVPPSPPSPPYAPSSPAWEPSADSGDEVAELSTVASDSDSDVEVVAATPPAARRVAPRATPPVTRKRTFEDTLNDCCTTEEFDTLQRLTLERIKKRKEEAAAMAIEKPTCTVCTCDIEAEDQAVIPPCGTRSKCVFHAQCFMQLTCRAIPNPYQCTSHKCPNCNAVWNRPNNVSLVKGPTVFTVTRTHASRNISRNIA